MKIWSIFPLENREKRKRWLRRPKPRSPRLRLPRIAEANQPNYHERKRLAEEKIQGLLGNQVTICQGNNSIVWTVVSDYCNPTV
jgi:hypothetical protein